MKKGQIEKLVKAIKQQKKFPRVTVNGMRTNLDYRERDMRKEAIDLGSHGAKEMWGDSNG